MSLFDDIAQNTPTIQADANYWFVRTNGGQLYHPFISAGCIAIGYNQVSMQFIRALNDAPADREKLKNKISLHYPPKRNAEGKLVDQSGLHASQLLRFCNGMKPGDIVMCPSEKTERISVGVIEEGEPFEEELTHQGAVFPEFSKRRPVRWIRGADKAELNPNLFKLFLNQQTIADANAYAHWIDALLYEFFRKGDEFHYVLRVEKEEHIGAQSLFGACVELLRLVEDFAASEGFDAGVDDIETRINLNSPGDVELWKTGIQAVALCALLIVGLNGGGFELHIKQIDLRLSSKTEGLLARLTQFLNERQRRKMVEDVRLKIQNLKVRTPQQLIDLIKNTKQ